MALFHVATLFQVLLTYRDEPVAGADDALIVENAHSVLGTRWVYDALRDPQFVVMLAAVAMTGQGEALGMAKQDGAGTLPRATSASMEAAGPGVGHPSMSSTLRNDRFELTVFRRPLPGHRPTIGLTAAWGERPSPVVLAEVTER